MAAVDPTNPQSWNRYAYVLNNPLSLVDPLGLDEITYCDENGCINYTDDGSGGPGEAPLAGTVTVEVTAPADPGPVPEELFTPDGFTNWIYGPPGGSGGAANNGTPKQTKQQCIDSFLKNNYGNFVGGKVVPDFSLIAIGTNFWGYAKSSALTLAVKGGLIYAPKALSWVATTTGNNLAAYQGMATASADALETGAFWGTTAVTAEWVVAPAAVGAVAFSTTADAYARWSCRNVQ